MWHGGVYYYIRSRSELDKRHETEGAACATSTRIAFGKVHEQRQTHANTIAQCTHNKCTYSQLAVAVTCGPVCVPENCLFTYYVDFGGPPRCSRFCRRCRCRLRMHRKLSCTFYVCSRFVRIGSPTKTPLCANTFRIHTHTHTTPVSLMFLRIRDTTSSVCVRVVIFFV